MKEEIARAILRIIAVITILVGVILTTTTLVSLVGLESSLRGATRGLEIQATGLVAEMGLYAVLAHLLVATWGFALYFASPKLAAYMVE